MPRPIPTTRFLPPLAGLSAAGLAATTLPGGVAVLVGGLVAATVVLGHTMVNAARSLGPGDRGVDLAGLSGEPADGVVPIVPLSGAVGDPNPARPETRRFVAWDGVPIGVSHGSRPDPRVLRGRIGLACLFIGRDGSGWDGDDVARAIGAAIRAGRWLEAEAIRWGAAVNLELLDTYFLADDAQDEGIAVVASLDPYESILEESDQELRALASASRAASALGFADFAGLACEVARRVDHDRMIWLVLTHRSGRSFALPAEPGRYPGVGVAVVHARDSSSTARLVGAPCVDPATIAHELLHLFGATDKYGTSLATFAEGSVTRRDIMRLSLPRLRDLRIDPLTAAEIGWIRPGRAGP